MVYATETSTSAKMKKKKTVMMEDAAPPISPTLSNEGRFLFNDLKPLRPHIYSLYNVDFRRLVEQHDVETE